MEQIIKISIHSLKIHPRNIEFFDNIEGDTYKQFKNSIKDDGVLTPIIIAPDMTIVSGHQRYLACKELGIELIPTIIREELVDEDLKLRQLIASNFGRLSNNPTKYRKAVAEYVGLVGNTGSGTWKQKVQDAPFKTQDEIAKELNISVDELKRIIKIENDLIPELQQVMDKGFISKTAALNICSKIDKSEQPALLTELTKMIGSKTEENPDKDKVKISNLEIEELNNTIKLLKDEKEKLAEKNTDLLMVQVEKEILKKQYDELSNNSKDEKERSDKKLKHLEVQEKLLKEKIEVMEENVGKYTELKDQISNLTKEKNDISRQIASATSLSGYIVDIEDFLKNKLAPIKYSRAILDTKDNPTVIKNITEIVECVELWCSELRGYLPKENNYRIIESEDI